MRLLVSTSTVHQIVSSGSLAHGHSRPSIVSINPRRYWPFDYGVGMDASGVAFLVDGHLHSLPTSSRAFCMVSIVFRLERRGDPLLTRPCRRWTRAIARRTGCGVVGERFLGFLITASIVVCYGCCHSRSIRRYIFFSLLATRSLW